MTTENDVLGIDVGGTKTEILGLGLPVKRYVTADYPDLYTLINEYFKTVQQKPKQIVVAMAGPRNDATGIVAMTNLHWPDFDPREAGIKYPGITFSTIHDASALAAGVALIPNLDLITLKRGEIESFGPKLSITISTGVGVSVAIWDSEGEKYIYFSGEAGHMGFQPSNISEIRHLAFLQNKYPHASVELAISGKHGIQNWIDHSTELYSAPDLVKALKTAEINNQPAGAVLLAFATEGSGPEKAAAEDILGNFGSLVGNVLADFALIYKSTGGIYVTGSVALGLGEYLAENTSFTKVFVRHGTPEHAPWLKTLLEKIPIYLINDSHTGVKGAYALAQQKAKLI